MEYSLKGQFKKIYEVTTPTQFFCMVITFMLAFYFPFILEVSKDYTRYRKLERPDYSYESINDFWMVIPICLALRVLKMIVDNYSKDYFTRNLKYKYSGNDLEQKVEKCLRGIFKVIFFSTTFSLGLFQVLMNTNFCPSFMGGSGNHLLTIGNYPYTPMPNGLKFYYMLSISYYIQDGIEHIFMTPKFDFWEMILHHVITSLLLFSSYMNGLWIIGAHILPMMDFEDIWIGLIRAFMDCGNRIVIIVTYAMIMTSWIYLRFFVSTYVILISFSFTSRVTIDNNFNLCLANTILLFILQGLNIYWFILL